MEAGLSKVRTTTLRGEPMTWQHDRRPAKALQRLLAPLGRGVLMAALLTGLTAPSPAARAAEPCCGVIAVDLAQGTVTAFERTSGNIFTFAVRDKSVLSRFRPCSRFDADPGRFAAAQKFSVDMGLAAPKSGSAAAPCCEITAPAGSAGRVLAVQPHARFDGVEIMLLDLKRTQGDLVTATCLYCNGGPARVDLAADLRARVTGAKLLDTANRIEHRIVRSGGPNGDPLVSDHGPGLKLDPNRTARTWMTFTAPDAGTANLVVPGASAPFQNVPIAR